MKLWYKFKLLIRFFFPKKEVVLLRQLKRNRLKKDIISVQLPDGYTISGIKAMEAYNEYKDLYFEEIYAFHPKNNEPYIIDGGAYVGFSIIWFKSKYPGAKITAFECDPKILETLHSNIQNNQLQNVNVIPAALDAKEGEKTFFTSDSDAGSFTQTHQQNQQKVQTKKLSSYLDREVDLLKLNIEGAEFDVLKEASSHLHKVREIIIEFHSFAEQKQRLQELLEILTNQGFRYLINHFDYESNYAVKPPFSMDSDKSYILLVYAKRNDLIT